LFVCLVGRRLQLSISENDTEIAHQLPTHKPSELRITLPRKNVHSPIYLQTSTYSN